MKLIPFLKLEIESAYEPSVLLPALAQKSQGKHSINGSPEPLVGSVTGNKFKACRAIGYRNSFLPIAVGQVLPAGRGSLIKLHLRPPLFAIVFMGFWFSGLLFALALVLVKGVQAQAILFILAILSFGYLLVQLCFWLEVPKIRRILAGIAGAS